MELPLEEYMRIYAPSQQKMGQKLGKPQQGIGLWLQKGHHTVHYDGRSKKPYRVTADKTVWEAKLARGEI